MTKHGKQLRLNEENKRIRWTFGHNGIIPIIMRPRQAALCETVLTLEMQARTGSWHLGSKGVMLPLVVTIECYVEEQYYCDLPSNISVIFRQRVNL